MHGAENTAKVAVEPNHTVTVEPERRCTEMHERTTAVTVEKSAKSLPSSATQCITNAALNHGIVLGIHGTAVAVGSPKSTPVCNGKTSQPKGFICSVIFCFLSLCFHLE